MTEHVAIFVQPYLNDILIGKKTIESRFTMRQIAPFNKVHVNDKVYLKQSGGKIIGEAIVRLVEYFSNLSPAKILDLIEHYKNELQLKSEFIEKKKESKYITFIWLKNVVKYVTPREFKHVGMQSWIILPNSNTLDNFLNQIQY
jgi:hypothetical protein